MDIISPETNIPIVTPNSPEGKERAKWEQSYNNPFNLRPIPWEQGGRYPPRNDPYPKMLYKASRPTHGNIAVTEQLTVNSEAEHAIANGDGWSDGQLEAIAAHKARDFEMAELAANRHAQERTMSEKAQAEALNVDQETVYHVPVIPETPIKRRGRPKGRISSLPAVEAT